MGALLHNLGEKVEFRSKSNHSGNFKAKVQGSQFTSLDFTQMLKDHGIDISMDGKGCWRDNVFVERLSKSIKYEEVYLRAYETVSNARTGIGRYLEFYNSHRPHSALDGSTPDEFAHLPALKLAA